MKNLLAKLKGLNYKQAAIDHGEKVFLGVIGLFVLMCLAGTSWSRYDKQPKEFQDKVEAGERNIQNSAWTVEEQNKYKPLEIMQAVQTLQSPLEVARYEYSTDWFWPMYPTSIKILEPKWLALIEPVADYGKAVIVELPPEQVQPPTTILAEVEGATSKKPVTDDDDEFAVRRPTTNTAGQSAAGIGAATPMNDAAGIVSAPTAGDYKSMMGGAAGMESMMGGSGPTINARGNRFIAVRAVFPLGDQLDELAKAMNENKRKVAEYVNFLDFEVERQVAQPGDQPWSGPWEKVDLQATLDLLDKIEFDTDLVDSAYTDNVFTMPLPRRVIGRWNKWASHRLIKVMTDEQAELNAQLNARLVEEAAKKKLDDKTAKKGFASRVHDARGLRGQFMGMGQMGSMMTGMAEMMKQGEMQSFNPNFGADQLAGAMPGFTEQVTQTGNGRMSKYLLFRYFDFQITPGNAYRYRVKLKLLNPNFKRPVEELVDESIAAGELRETPWSEPTPPAVVPEEQRIFLAKADKPRPDTGLPSANLDVYQWFAEAGTTIAAKVEKLQLGQFIGGRCPKTEVYRPASDTLKEEEVPVFTGNLLADVAVAPTAAGFDLTEHADLKLDDKKLKQWTTADKALVVDRFGQMAILDTKSAMDERQAAESVVENERRGVRARLKERPATTDSSGGDLSNFVQAEGGAGGTDPMMMQQMMMMQGMGGGNALKKGAKPQATKKPPKGKAKGGLGPGG